MKKIALITGATAGIGEATAILLAKNSFNLILTGRRAEKLQLLKDKLVSETDGEILLLNFDIRSLEETSNAINNLPDEWKNIDVLINNAGLAAGMSNIHEGDIEDWEQMIDTNVKGLLYITRLISPIMVKRGTGHIVNISSIAGKETYPMEMFTVQQNMLYNQ